MATIDLLRPLVGGQLAVGAAAVGLADAAGVDADDVAAASVCALTVKGGGVRYRFAGDPTASAGLYHDDLRGPLVVTGRALLAALRLVRDAGSAGTVTVDFELLAAV